MDLYFITQRLVGINPLTTTRELIASAAPVDRTVIVQEVGGQGNTNISFSETGDHWGVEPAPSGSLRDFQFVLPAGTELWAASSPSAGESGCAFIVTSVGR